MAITMATAGLTGCKSKDTIANKIEDNLKQEIGEEFKVFWLKGSLFDTDYEAYVSPVSNRDIRFTVNTDGDGKPKYFKKSFYYSAKVWNDFAQEIIKAFDANGIEVFCKAEAGSAGNTIPKITSLDTTVKEYIEMNPNYEFGIDVILNESDAMNKETLNKMVKSLEKVNETYPGICIYGAFFFYDVEGYSKAKNYFNKTVSPSYTILQDYDVKYSCWNGLKDNKVNYNVEEVLKNLEADKNVAY